MPARVLLLTDSGMSDHAAIGHPERPERLGATVQGVTDGAVAVNATLDRPAVEPADDLALQLVHTAWYLETLDAAAARGGGWVDPDTYLGHASRAAARLAAGATLQAAVAVAGSHAEVAFAVVRPPGHHAGPERAAGFCIINNVAVAAAWLRQAGLAQRIAIVDWDVHHGDGTQAIFEADPELCYASTHQSPLYPGTGAINEQGADKGFGCNLNIPLPPGATGDVYVAGLDRVVGPLVQVFEPTWLLISAGFDAHRRDPLTDLGLTSGDFGLITRRLIELVPTAKRIMVLEGGYDLQALADSSGAAMAALLGVDDEPEKPTAGGPGHRVLDTVSERWGDLLPS